LLRLPTVAAYFEKRSKNMQWIFVVICFSGTIASAIYLKSLDLNGGVTAAIIIPLVFLTIYSLARMKPNKPVA
jgi:hypothetical protein